MKCKNPNKILTLGALPVIALSMVSCQNELGTSGNISGNGNDGVNLVRGTDVIVWSGQQILGSTVYGETRSEVYSFPEDYTYDFNFPAETDKAIEINTPTDAVRYTASNQGSGVYYIPAGDYSNGIFFANNANLEIYVEPGARVKNIGSDISSLELYIKPGAMVTMEWQSMNNCNVYNAGDFYLPNGFDGEKIKNIYTSGSLFIGQDSEWGKELPGGVSIYSKGGFVQFFSNNAYQNEWWYSQSDVKGTIISDNIVFFTGKVKFQGNGRRDICNLVSTDCIEFTAGNNVFGNITAPDMKFDGNFIKLHPNGFVNISNEIKIPNSGSGIQAYDGYSTGLVKCKTLNINLVNAPLQKAIGEGLYLTIESILNQATGETITDFSGVSVGSPDHINQKVEMQPGCACSVTEGDNGGLNPDNGENDEAPGKEPEKNDGNTPDTPFARYHNREVEVNYAILDDHKYPSGISDLVTKLSIHVRFATDIDIKIPIPNKYLVESDDLYIFQEHYMGEYGGNTNTLENQSTELEYPIYNSDKTIAGIVKLHVDFVTPASDDFTESGEGYIHVWTEGIDDNVIAACWDKNKDGVNFEIFNYFQTEKAVWNEDDEFATIVPASDLNREALLKAMNKSQIKFLDEAPDYFINAFGYDYENGIATNKIHPAHAVVTPAPSEGYKEPYRTTHLNSTPYNDIYVLGSLEQPDNLHSHN